MSHTSVQLLKRLRDLEDTDSSRRLFDLYVPLIQRWLRGNGVQTADVDDLVQEVLCSVAKAMPSFEHSQRPGAFRHWLRTTTAKHLQTFWRTRRYKGHARGGDGSPDVWEQLHDPASDMSRQWDLEHDEHVVACVLKRIESGFHPATFRAFQLQAIHGRRAADVAAELGLSVNAVLLAKSRVFRKLREDCRQFID